MARGVWLKLDRTCTDYNSVLVTSRLIKKKTPPNDIHILKPALKKGRETGLCGNYSPVSLPKAFCYILKGHAQHSFIIYYFLFVIFYLNSFTESVA